MKNLFTCLLAIASLALIASCKRNVLRGEGDKGTASPAVSSFNEVSVDLSLNTVINVQPGSSPSVQLAGHTNLLKHIVATVKDNCLYINTDLDDTWKIESDDVVVTVTVPSIASLSLTGSSDASIHGAIAGPSFLLDITGSGDVIIDNVSSDTLAVEASGATKLKINGGKVKIAHYDISGAGEINAYPLQTEETIAEISGAGTSHVTATNKLVADISGAGSVKYKGHPNVVKDVSGAGSVTDAN